MTDPSVTAANLRVASAETTLAAHMLLFRAACLGGTAAPDRTAVEAAQEALLDAIQDQIAAIRAASFR